MGGQQNRRIAPGKNAACPARVRPIRSPPGVRMSLEENVPEAPKVRRRPGPKPGAKKRRHDPEPAPIDGDYQPLDVVGKEPGFEYFALSNHDRQRRGHQFEVVRWSEKCAHSPWEVFSEDLRGKEVKIN